MKIEYPEQDDDEEEDIEETREEENILSKDVDFLIFKKNIKHEPDHIIRYCFSPASTPLYYSSYEKNIIKKTKCEYCGKKKSFEFQINCTILNSIPELSKFDWGILAIYSCYDVCFQKDLILYEETVFV